MIKFADALMKFRNTVMAEYGPKADIFKIGISPELLDQIKTEFAAQPYYAVDDPRVGGIKICGTDVVAAAKDRFVRDI